MRNFMKTILSGVKAWTDGRIKASVADWNQDDSGADNYVKNRTHYDTREYQNIEITFDGNIEGKETIELEEGSVYCVKISDETYPSDAFINGTFVFYSYGEEFTDTINEDLLVYISDDGYAIGSGILVVLNDTTIGGISYTQGIWAMCFMDEIEGPLNYMKSISGKTIVGELKKLDEKYLPDDLLDDIDFNSPASWFTVNETGETITGLTDEGKLSKEIVIPSKINDVIITGIGDKAFEGCTNLTNITIPDSVTSIGDRAFYNTRWLEDRRNEDPLVIVNNILIDATNINSIDIPDTVTSIGKEVFRNCTKLTSVTIPDSVTSIGDWAFYGCTNLTSVTIGNSVTSIGDNAFYGCTKLTNIIIPDSVTSIGYQAFYNNPWLANKRTENPFVIVGNGILIDIGTYNESELVIPDSVTSIGKNVFEYYNSTSIIIPDSVTSIDDFAFIQSNITSITIGNNVTSIGKSAFERCTSLTSVTIGNSVTSIGYSAFEGCTKLTSITIPDSVTNIDDYAFYKCASLTSVTIPDSVTSIGNDAFKSTQWLANKQAENPLVIVGNGVLIDGTTTSGDVTIPDSVTSIGDHAFYKCTNLTNITIPDSVTSIGDEAFFECNNLINITIGNSVTSIGDYAFYKCTKLTTITIPDSATSIGKDAFCDCTSLTSVTIGNSVTSIGDYAFHFCNKLTTITIPDNVTSIGYEAFHYTPWLANKEAENPLVVIGRVLYSGKQYTESKLVIPDNITSIGGGAFSYCDNLTTIIIPDSVISIGEYAFKGCANLTAITIPDSVTSIGDYIFADCTNLTNITIGNGVTSIDNYVFDNCTNLTNITIGNGVISIGEYAFNDTPWLANKEAENPLVIANGILIEGGKPSGSLIIPDTYVKRTLCDVVIPDTVTTINYNAFENTSVVNLTIGDGVVHIEDNAFNNCGKLETINLGINLTNINQSAFGSCTSLNTIYYRGAEEYWNNINIESNNDPLLNANKIFNCGTPIQKMPIVSSSDAGKSLQVSETGEWIVQYALDNSDINSNAIIDVVELPTENINENAFYRLQSAELVGKNTYTFHCHVVNTLPETGVYIDTNIGRILIYYNLSDGNAYVYADQTAIKNPIFESIGWYSIEHLYEKMTASWGGIITDINEANKDEVTHHLFLYHSIWLHKDGQWIPVTSACREGEGKKSVIFNDLSNSASGIGSHAQGYEAHAQGNYSHAEGNQSYAQGDNSHAEGYSTHSEAYGSHAEGCETYSQGNYSHTEGYNTYAQSWHSHAEGKGTIAACANQHAQGQYNIIDPEFLEINNRTPGKYVHIVGNGTADDARSNAHTLDWSGLGWFAGGLKVGGTGQDDENAKEVALKEDIAPAVEEAVAGMKDDLVSDVLSALPMWEGGNY